MHNTSVSASALITAFLDARMINIVDAQLADRLSVALQCREDDLTKLALALTHRNTTDGAVCVELDSVHLMKPIEECQVKPDWPDPQLWAQALSKSALVNVGHAEGQKPLRFIDGLLYLERYWHTERIVVSALSARANAGTPPFEWSLANVDASLNEAQRAAVAAAGFNYTSVVTGGPGTGKTRTIASILRALASQEPPTQRPVVVSPTGRAAAKVEDDIKAQLQEGEHAPPSMTVHRLLGLTPARPYAPKFHAKNPLPHDCVIVDETSMMSLTLMSQLLDAMRIDARLVLVGDAHQLASVDAGAVLLDIVNAPHLIESSQAHAPIVHLRENYRFGSDTAIGAAATAINAGDADALFDVFGDAITLTEINMAKGIDSCSALRDTIHEASATMYDAARDGRIDDALDALDAHRLLCAHKNGPYGASFWNQQIKRSLPTSWKSDGEPYVGQPQLVIANAGSALSGATVWNGDSGVVVKTDQGPRLAFRRGQGIDLVAWELLPNITDLYAMTIHKSQGSQFDSVSIILPDESSPLLTRELLYTAVTRAKTSVSIYGSHEALRLAVTTPAKRASGLALRPR